MKPALKLALVGLLLFISANPSISNANESSDLIKKIAGVYKFRFGEKDKKGYPECENILELVEHSENTIYFRTHLEFGKGCSFTCSLWGVASYQNGKFHYQEHRQKKECNLDILFMGDKLELKDPENSCKGSCGANASLMDVSFSFSAKRKIHYLERLKNSRQYKAAVTEFTDESKPASPEVRRP